MPPPEDAGEMEDLRAFTRDLARQMEADLGTDLDWIAVEHWNTDNPHVHLLVRGVDDKGKDLVIARDYISTGLRSRAEDLVSIELGPKPEHEITNALEREIDADRWTRLDGAIRSLAEETGHVDLRPDNGITGSDDPEFRRLLIRRMQKLEDMGLATSKGSGEWTLKNNAEKTLRELGMRDDIIKTMHRAFTSQGQDRGIGDYAIDSASTLSGDTPVIGRLVEKGLHDELTGEAYAVIDATDGRAHHVRFRGVEVFEHAPDIGGVVEVRRFGSPDDPKPTLTLANRSDLDLQHQITAPGATWLDHRLVESDPMPLAERGFGAEVRNAMSARAEHLTEEGLARRQGQRIILQRNLLSTLRSRELDAMAQRLATETGLHHLDKAKPGEYVSGTIRQRLDLSSGRFAMIETVDPDGGPGFRLVPWSKEIDRNIGRHITGVMRDTGGIDWGIGRSRGLGL
ncbi:type IV secretory pathway VirD2 relaxase [Ochrobactrum pecoris]|nr:type IV secretory pathway VirD2 relaxase [Brucella pecoris]